MQKLVNWLNVNFDVGFREMKKAIRIIILGLLFITAPSYASDIVNFEIGGFAVNNILLDHFSDENCWYAPELHPLSISVSTHKSPELHS